jgi:nitroreductase
MSDADLGTAHPHPPPTPKIAPSQATRPSAPAQALIAPGPSSTEVDRILALGARTPDHGKLFPWRFVVMGPRSRADLAARLGPLTDRQPQPDKARAVLSKLVNPPLTILVISAPVPSQKVPEWEQQLSAGAVCMNIEHAAGALGYSTSWITDWYAYDREALALYGVGEEERVAGFIHIGTLADPPLERPRPDLTTKVTRLA